MKITELDNAVASLSDDDRAVFNQVYDITKSIGKTNPPEPMHYWATQKFGSVDAVRKQAIIRVTNNFTYEGTLFNELRSIRPMDAETVKDVRTRIVDTNSGPFCKAMKYTPEDVFGRVKGKHCITASNVAKYDYFHGLVIFNQHDPLDFELEDVADYADTAMDWFKEAHKVDQEAKFPFLMWNCLWRSGASIVHGHAQMTLTTKAYPKIQLMRDAMERYKEKYNSSLWDDIFRSHEALGLGMRNEDSRLMAYLTPIKEMEMVAFSKDLSSPFKSDIYKMLDFYKRTKQQSFNLVLEMPPLEKVDGWEDFPYIARIVSRGGLDNEVCDIGSMELYTCSVVGSDPFQVMEQFKKGQE